jgi:hypothetical protein
VQPSAGGSEGSSGGSGGPSPTGDGKITLAHACAKCGAPLDVGQDWCLQCGTGAPDSLSSRTPTWRSAAVILTTLAILVAGAGTAAYAALSKNSPKAKPVTTAVAQVPTPTAATPVSPVTPEVGGTATAKIGTPTTVKPLLPGGTIKPPKIPLTATPTPKIPVVTTPANSGGSSTTTPSATKKHSEAAVPVGEAQSAEALLLDTDAAATYNPYNYAASNFGDPSLAIDGDVSTGWTALVEPSVAPKMAEGLVIDLNTSRKLAALALDTTTPGMTVQVYGANGVTPPASIIDPAWVSLSPSLVEKKRHVRIKFGGTTAAAKLAAKQPYRFIALWISQAPAAFVGTPQAPGHVSVNELELFPRKK